MSDLQNTRSVSGMLTTLWGDTPPGRFLARTGAKMLLILAIWIGLRWTLSYTSVDYGVAPGFPWRTMADFVIASAFLLCLVWFGFQLSLGLQAKQGDSVLWATPALLLCGLVALLMAQSAGGDVWQRLTETDLPMGVALFLRAGQVALLIALVWSSLPLLPSLIARAQTFVAARNAAVKAQPTSTPVEPLFPPQQDAPVAESRSVEPSRSIQPVAASPAQTVDEAPPGETAPANRLRFCPQCGATLKPGVKFCRGCGFKVGA